MSTAILEPAPPPATTTQADAAVAYEQERGKPVPGYNHSIVQTNLVGELLKQERYRPHSELNLDLNGWRCVPDICLFPKTSGLVRDDIAWVTDVPAMAVEIFSPAQTMEQMTHKVKKLLEAGVPSVWLVMPPVHLITVFQKDMAPVSVTQGTVTVPVTGVSVNVDAVFS